ncbi:glycosyltransferase family 4 protein [Photobacterium alginatilyticum]|uniref:Glycosyltransferase family 1 protein n=1 Tax=Photobacterium alginatilyticum TaxID=1775171 RepID=A0ABW9YFC8_9GAMM|nr:glycosyltransferase family 4 protein [Photobacterium alginatilyticum]NBI52492.1 glycosyltransferase family 1 protein [Photobacterium alginatilyticum]
MKILYHHRVASRDGQFVHIEAIIDALRQQGHEVIVVAPTISDATEFGDDGGWMSKLRHALPGFISELLEFGYSLYDFVQLLRAIKKHRPDVIYERYNLFLPSGIWAKQLFNLPLILEVNAPLYKERAAYGGVHLPMLAKWSELYTWRNADHLLPVTHVLADYLYQAGVRNNNVTVIANGIDPSQFNVTTHYDRLPDLAGKTVIGFVGFCREWHRLDLVVETIAEMRNPNLVLLIVGIGSVLDDLQQKARELNIERQLLIAGLVSREEMPKWLAQVDIALQPAVTPWCSPLKLIEYLATGKAVVAPDAPNIQELLVHESNALLFEEGDNQQMLAAIKRLVTEADLKADVQHQAVATIENRQLTWHQNAKKIVRRFQLLLQDKRGAIHHVAVKPNV